MDKRKVVFILLIISLSILYINAVKVKIKPGLETVKASGFVSETREEEHWKDIEDFLNKITDREIATGDFYLFGAEKGTKRFWLPTKGICLYTVTKN